MSGNFASTRLPHFLNAGPCAWPLPSMPSINHCAAWHISWASVERSRSYESRTFSDSSIRQLRSVPRFEKVQKPAVVCRLGFQISGSTSNGAEPLFFASIASGSGSCPPKTAALNSRYSSGAAARSSRFTAAALGVRAIFGGAVLGTQASAAAARGRACGPACAAARAAAAARRGRRSPERGRWRRRAAAACRCRGWRGRRVARRRRRRCRRRSP